MTSVFDYLKLRARQMTARKVASNSILSQYDRSAQREILRLAKEKLLQQQQGNILLKSLGMGAAVGGIGAGTFGLAKQMSRAISPPRITYTLPNEFEVYEPEKKKKPAATKAAASPSGTPGGYSLFRSPVSELVAKDPRLSSQAWLALAAGLPAGFLAGIKINKSLGRVARNQELEAAREDFERAMQESAGLQEVEGQKVANSPVAILAENCKQMSKLALDPADLKKMLYIYMAAAPAVGAYYGFQKRWDQRKARSLEAAERLSNVNRETTNPTFSTARLVTAAPHSRSATKREESIKKLDSMLNEAAQPQEEFPYL